MSEDALVREVMPVTYAPRPIVNAKRLRVHAKLLDPRVVADDDGRRDCRFAM